MLNECACGCSGSGGCSEKRPESYMFFDNLKTIQRAAEEMMKLDPKEVDNLLKNGHAWAVDHIATSKDDVEEVASFLLNQKEPTGEARQMQVVVPFVHTFESFINEGYKKEYGEETSVDDFKSIEKGSSVLYRGKKWKVTRANEYILELEDSDGNKKRVNRNQFKEYGAIS